MKRDRSDYIMIKVTHEEKERIKAAAFAADLSVSGYCRRVLFAAQKKSERDKLDRTV